MPTRKPTPCPRCGYPGPDLRSQKGGKAGTGKSKARTSEQARAAANARWAPKEKGPAKDKP